MTFKIFKQADPAQATRSGAGVGAAEEQASPSPEPPAPSSDPTSFLDLMVTKEEADQASSGAVRTWSAAAIGQVVAMMGDDARTHLQAMEQIYVAANAKALVLLSNEATAATGTTMLQQIALSQTATTAFASGAADVAAAFAKL